MSYVEGDAGPDPPGDWELLGAPVVDMRFEVLTQRVEGIRCLVQALPSLNNPHIEFTLLCSCFAFPKFSSSMRSSELS